MTVGERACPNCGSDNPERARFCWSCGTSLAGEAAPAAETRKTVTVLFCDATSSTTLGEQMDPESLRNLMTRYFDLMRVVIQFHGGVVEKFIGDAVMAVFGVPTVHEDDALRACRAAVEIRDRLALLDTELSANRGVTIEWRMGVNTGQVVAGDASAGQRIVTGDAVNVAARLEAAAAPGEILLGAATQRLVRDSVTTEAVEPLALKGKAAAVPAHRLLGVTDRVARHARPLDAPLVGRRRHLQALNHAFSEVVEERVCHLFTVLGVAGVGKSRLVEEFLASLGDQATVAHGRCLSYGHGITFWPVSEAIRGAAGLTDSDAPNLVQTRLVEILGADPEGRRVAAIVGGLLGLETSVSAPDETFSAVRKLFEAVARRKPLMLVFDDVHWGEPTFLDLVEHIADWTRDAPILLVCMARSELLEVRPGWGGGKRWVTTIQLEPLSDLESEELVVELLGRAELPETLRTRIGQAAEGNPLFVEELLGMLIDDGFLVQGGDGWTAVGDARHLAMPPTIHALIEARLDGLRNEDRAVIERAAIEGKVFHRGAVTELSPEAVRGQIRDRLATLMRMELVRPDQAAFSGEEAYRFRHLLIRDAAYQALAKQSRAELHERFAGWLERNAHDRLAEFEEILAYHFEQAYRYRIELGLADDHASGLGERAAGLLAAAGERSFERRDVNATVELLGRAAALMPEESAERRLVIPTLGAALYAQGDGNRAFEVLTAGVAAAERAGDELAAARTAIVLVEVKGSVQATDVTAIIREAERLKTIFERLGDERGGLRADLVIGRHLFFFGRAEEAEARLRDVIRFGPGGGSIVAEAIRFLPSALFWGPTAVPDAILGAEEMIRLAPGPRAAFAKRSLAALWAMQGRFDEARELLAEARRAAEDMGDRVVAASVVGHFGATVELLAGNYKAAANLARQGFDELTSLGDKAFASTAAGHVGRALIDLGEDEEAWRWASIAREISAPDDVDAQVAGREVQARVLSRRGDHGAAEELAREAIGMADATDYLTLRASAWLSFAFVQHEAGRSDEAVNAARTALELYERKGATVLVDHARALIAGWSASP
jgi:class 3 adenylate cyclase/tetratricopeptide (TPR) repeat protein